LTLDIQRIREFSDLTVGMAGAFTKPLTDEDVRAFAEASGDRNPIHLDEAFAKTTVFKKRIAHGMLTAGIISAAFAEVLPGPGWVYVSQSLKFRAPVFIGDTVSARVEVIDLIPEKKFAAFRTECTINDKIVLEGEATLMAPPV
jgi:3-hydroxybutyryl-CoA dehydratase